MRLNVENEMFVCRYIFRLVFLYEFQEITKRSEKSFVKKLKTKHPVIIDNFVAKTRIVLLH